MKRVISAIVGIFFSTAASAQYLTPAVNSNLFPSTPSAGNIPIAQSSTTADFKAISGDATLAAAGGLTLATVNSNVGSFGSATQCVLFTTNGKGLITAASAVTCTPALASITGLTNGITNSMLAQMTADTVKCNPTGSTANAQDCASPVVSGTVTALGGGGGPTSAFFTSSVTGSGFGWQTTGSPADQKNWDILVEPLTPPNLSFRAVNDANSAASTWMIVSRGAGATVSSVSIPSPIPLNIGDQSWLETLIPFTTSVANTSSVSPINGIGVLGAARASDLTTNGGQGVSAFNNCNSTTSSCWGFYGEVWNNNGSSNSAFTTAMELDIVNKNATPVLIDPFSINPGGETADLWIASGGSRSGVHTASAAMVILNNGANFNAGIIFSSNSLAGGNPAILLPYNYQIVWYTSTGVTGGSIISTSAGGLSLQVGSALAASVFFDQNAHVDTTSGLAPSLASCGSGPSPSIVGNDWAGEITTGGGATSCNPSFSHAYVSTPKCLINPSLGGTPPVITARNNFGIIFNASANTSYTYHCFGAPGG
jgi:hypothetical protein